MAYTKEELKRAISDKLSLTFGAVPEEATDEEMMKACAYVIRDMMALREIHSRVEERQKQERKVHYLSLEFLMGRSLMKNAYNLGALEAMSEALEELGFKAADVFECEPDAGLGNGGLGRLAACYLDSMTTLEIPATGYSICYDLGIFKQRIVEGQQAELPDDWKGLGGAWLIEKPVEAQEVHFGGHIREFWADGRHHTVHEGYTTVLAIPNDMLIAGFETRHTNTLRLWQAKSRTPLDMSLFSRGEYLEATEERAMAESISKILYPEDNHMEGRELRLKQEYFFVSATVQDAVRKHVERYGTIGNFHEKNMFQINDTHPAVVIPELMRVLIDDMGLGWDEAWYTTSHSVAYTNHTVLAEALECWSQNLFETLLPRIWEILVEISNRWQRQVESEFHDENKTRKMAVIWGGQVRMANLCLAGCSAVNGVSALHTEILRSDVFREACEMEPEKFQNVTNGIDHRRWLSQINPGLDRFVSDLTGSRDYLLRPTELQKLERFQDDGEALRRLFQVKRANKAAFSDYAKKTQGVLLNPDAIFDVQVKRLHEYKRQLLNVMHIIYLYQKLQDSPNLEMQPHTFLFGAKAAPGYAVAKRIIHLINSLAVQVNSDPVCRDKLQVVFLENYCVSLAEKLMPASEVSQQISTAGKEASGTGNMKFMMNGALTVGTLDGANVEMHELLGDENMFLFGLKADEAAALKRGGYDPHAYCERDAALRRVLEQIRTGFSDGVSYDDLYRRLVTGDGCPADEYLLLADFAPYCEAEQRMVSAYGQRDSWNRMSLLNIARSGFFAADRSIAQYAGNIWRVRHR